MGTDVAFLVDGTGPYTLTEMLAANADSTDVCEWAQVAKPGDVLRDIVECRCVAARLQ